MIIFDPEFAKAELDRYIIIIRHHIRQIRLNKDRVAAVYFNRELGAVAEAARRAKKEIL